MREKQELRVGMGGEEKHQMGNAQGETRHAF